MSNVEIPFVAKQGKKLDSEKQPSKRNPEAVPITKNFVACSNA